MLLSTNSIRMKISQMLLTKKLTNFALIGNRESNFTHLFDIKKAYNTLDMLFQSKNAKIQNHFD